MGKNIIDKRFVTVTLVILLLLASFAWSIYPNNIVNAVNASALAETQIPLPQPDITLHKDAEGFTKFDGESIQHLGETGEPSIPYQGLTILLPPNVELSTVKAEIIEPQWTKLDGEWDVKPVPPLATWDGEKELIVWPEDKNIVDGKDLDIYNANAIYPAEVIGRVDTVVIRELNIANIFYATYRYNPLEKTLYKLTGGTLQVTYEKAVTNDDEPPSDLIGIEAIQENAINFNEAIIDYENFASNAPGCYVIITTSAIQSSSVNLANFVASKEARGFTVHIVTEGTWGGGCGDTAAENIRSWLQSNYLGWNIEYVLLIGNPDPSIGDVPMKMLWPRNNSGSYQEAPSDFYYAELTSNWDADSDGKYGEYDDDFSNNPPCGAEVKVGRIPYYGDINDLDHILSKTATFENAQTGDITWRKNILLPMEPSDSSTPGYHLGEEIKDSVLIPTGWEYHRVYEEQYGLTPSPETTPCSVSGVTTAWNSDQFGGIFWWTHGSETYAADIMDLSHAATLDDSHPGFTFQCSCYNGHPETTNNLGYSLLKNGCAATVSASRVSWYYVGQTSFAGTPSNSGLTYEYSKRLITEEMDAGSALNDIRLDIVPGSSATWMNYLVFNLYGDPAVGLYTSSNTGVVYNNHLIDDSGGNGEADSGESFTLDMTLENLEAQDATNVSAVLSTSDPYVTITDDSEAWGTISAYSTSSQLDAFALDIADNIPDQRAVSFLVSATGEGTVPPPWNSSFSIIVNAPELTVGSITIDDSGGDADGILDPGETANVLVDTSNTGHLDAEATTASLFCASSYIAVNTPIHDFGTLSCGESDTAIFSVTIAPDAPIGELVEFEYSVTSGSYSAEESFTKMLGCTYQQVGYGTWTVPYPFNTWWLDSRTQSILLADEIQFAGSINTIKLYCTQLPGQNLENFYIRMQHTAMDSFTSNEFVNDGWTNVLSASDVDVSQWNVPGWVEFQLTTPFDYNGIDNLLIDYCVDNSFRTYEGWCYATEADCDRTLEYCTDNSEGNLLDVSYGQVRPWFNNVILTDSPVPALIAPMDGSLFTPADIVTFQWSAEPTAVEYTIQIDTDANFGSPDMIEWTVSDTQFSISLPLHGIHYWHVRTVDGSGRYSAYSDTWSLTIADPVVQISDDPNWDYRPAVTQTDDGTIWVVWESDRDWQNHVWYATSDDIGHTWSAEMPLDTGYSGGHAPDITQTDDGNLWLVWFDYRSGTGDLWYMTSPDYGSTWLPAMQLTNDPNSDYNPSITQTDDGTIWVVWQSYRSGNGDIWYKTSTDYGATWSEDTQLTTDPGYDTYPSITQDFYDGKIWIAWQSDRSGGAGIWVTNSEDGGATWSPYLSADLNNWGQDPEISSTDDGALWLVWYSWDSDSSNIWYMNSPDGGVSSSEPIRFTRFIGPDEYPAAAGLIGGELALVWQSDRPSTNNNEIWCGVIGRLEDINPPPRLEWAGHDPQGPGTDQVVNVRAQVNDESGILDVQLVWWQDGVPQPDLQMYDDGNHDDYSINDGVYGTQIGPFPIIGTMVEYQIQITDIDGNTVITPVYPFSFEVQSPFVKTSDILLVADNPGYGDWYIHYYTDALENAGYDYDIWEINQRGSIGSYTLSQYLDGIVIWSTPDWGYLSFSEHTNNLANYLDSGGKLFISGQNIGSRNIGLSWFYQDYLHAQLVQDNIGLYGLYSVPPIDPMYLSISGSYGANNQYAPDEIDPIAPAETTFVYDPGAILDGQALAQIDETAHAAQYNLSCMPGFDDISDRYSQQPAETIIGTTDAASSGTGALRVDTGTYRLVYFAFGFEAINSASDRAMVMSNVLEWLSGQCWSVSMQATTPTEGSNPNLVFGTYEGATDGYDSDIDIPHPPPAQGNSLDAYFSINDDTFYQLDNDFRDPYAFSQWILHAESELEDITLTWNSDSIPPSIDVYMFTGIDVIDMRSQDSVILPPGYYDIIISQGVEVGLPLNAGWNMVSAPVIPMDPSCGAVFPGAAAVYTWNPAGKSYDYVAPGDIITPDKGYWVAVPSDTVIPIFGLPVYDWMTGITKGWNMIGSVTDTVDFNSPDDDPDGSVETFAYAWDTVARHYILTYEIASTQGSWIAATQDCTLTLGAPDPTPTPTPTPTQTPTPTATATPPEPTPTATP